MLVYSPILKKKKSLSKTVQTVHLYAFCHELEVQSGGYTGSFQLHNTRSALKIVIALQSSLKTYCYTPLVNNFRTGQKELVVSVVLYTQYQSAGYGSSHPWRIASNLPCFSYTWIAESQISSRSYWILEFLIDQGRQKKTLNHSLEQSVWRRQEDVKEVLNFEGTQNWFSSILLVFCFMLFQFCVEFLFIKEGYFA